MRHHVKEKLCLSLLALIHAENPNKITMVLGLRLFYLGLFDYLHKRVAVNKKYDELLIYHGLLLLCNFF